MFEGMFNEPSADARVFAKNMRDFYVALIQQGFSEDQAFKLVDTMIWSAMIGNKMGGE